MSDPDEKSEDLQNHGRVSGSLQKIIGEVEAVGGILTGDPDAISEGEFNQEVGDIREELEDEMADDRRG
ncbi:MAG: hypothetical protein JO053_08940 [Acidobacteria bacterium]|nr:hypothetical protein [Acidobacteriota bacterium]